MDNNQVGVISCVLILLASTSTKHIDLVEASLVVDLSQETKIIDHFQINTSGGSFGDTRNQQGYIAYTGYGKHIDRGFRGVHGNLNIWSPHVNPGDISAASIAIGQVYNGIKVELVAGWMVNPTIFYDQHPRIFASYLNKYAVPMTCYTYDPHCVGFTITRHDVFTRQLYQTSVYEGSQYSHDVIIIQDKTTKNWLLQIDNSTVGYWNHTLVSTFDDGASVVTWTGHVLNSGYSANPTPLGSGRPPREGFGRASFIKEVQYINRTWSVTNDGSIRKIESHPKYYRVGALVFG